MVMVVSEVKPEVKQETATKKKTKKTKKEEVTPPTTPPTPTPPKEEVTPPTTLPPIEPPKEAKKKAEEKVKKEAKKEVKKEAKETKPTTKEAKPETKPPTKPAPTKRLRIETIDWEKFEKFETKSTSQKKSWIQVVIEKAKKEPTKVTGLTRGRLMALITAVNRHNMNHEPKIMIKYDTKKGIALLAPITKQHFTKQ
jgi:hypothetical protein